MLEWGAKPTYVLYNIAHRSNILSQDMEISDLKDEVYRPICIDLTSIETALCGVRSVQYITGNQGWMSGQGVWVWLYFSNSIIQSLGKHWPYCVSSGSYHARQLKLNQSVTLMRYTTDMVLRFS